MAKTSPLANPRLEMALQPGCSPPGLLHGSSTPRSMRFLSASTLEFSTTMLTRSKMMNDFVFEMPMSILLEVSLAVWICVLYEFSTRLS